MWLQAWGTFSQVSPLKMGIIYIGCHDDSRQWCIFVVVQLLSCVWLFVTLWTAAHSFTISQSQRLNLGLPHCRQICYHLSYYLPVKWKSLSRVWLFVTHGLYSPWISPASLLKFMPIQSVMLSGHLILCHPLLLRPSILPSIRVISKESALHIRWPK